MQDNPRSKGSPGSFKHTALLQIYEYLIIGLTLTDMIYIEGTIKAFKYDLSKYKRHLDYLATKDKSEFAFPTEYYTVNKISKILRIVSSLTDYGEKIEEEFSYDGIVAINKWRDYYQKMPDYKPGDYLFDKFKIESLEGILNEKQVENLSDKPKKQTSDKSETKTSDDFDENGNVVYY